MTSIPVKRRDILLRTLRAIGGFDCNLAADELERAWARIDEEYNRGLEAAALWHIQQTDDWSSDGNPVMAGTHRAYAKDIRALKVIQQQE